MAPVPEVPVRLADHRERDEHEARDQHPGDDLLAVGGGVGENECGCEHDPTLTDAPAVSRERPLDRLVAGRLARAREKLALVLGLLEHPLAEESDTRGPGRPVVARALGPELGAERDQLAHVGDRLD